MWWRRGDGGADADADGGGGDVVVVEFWGHQSDAFGSWWPQPEFVGASDAKDEL